MAMTLLKHVLYSYVKLAAVMYKPFGLNVGSFFWEQVEGGWRLNGQKRWIGNATFADIAVVFVRNIQTNQINGYAIFRLASSFYS